MFSLLILLWISPVFAQTATEPAPGVSDSAPAAAEAPVAPPVEGQAPAPSTEAAPAQSADDGEYEIDYEEEPEGDEPVQTPAPRKSKSTRPSIPGGSGPAVQGSRAKKRFTPILKSETKSVYRKEGKGLDVDTD